MIKSEWRDVCTSDLDGHPWPQLALVQDVDGHLHRLRLGIADAAIALRVPLVVSETHARATNNARMRI